MVILELVCTLKTPKISAPDSLSDVFNIKNDRVEISDQSKTVAEAVNCLISNLTLKDKSKITQMSEDDLPSLDSTLGLNIRNRFLYPRNGELLESCREVSGDKYLNWDKAAATIIRELWNKLRETHKIRVVK